MNQNRKYNLLLLIILIIFCFPVAYYYYFSKQFPGKKILKEKPQKYIFISLVVFYIILLPFGMRDALKSPPLYTDDALYNCLEGKYSFSESEPLFKQLQISFIELQSAGEDNKCALFLDYKMDVPAVSLTNSFIDSDESDFMMDTDICTLTMSQLIFYRDDGANFMTMIKGANCDFKTNLFFSE